MARFSPIQVGSGGGRGNDLWLIGCRTSAPNPSKERRQNFQHGESCNVIQQHFHCAATSSAFIFDRLALKTPSR
jgi:hypothetical protein